jgi:PAS domain S-box-containing protein
LLLVDARDYGPSRTLRSSQCELEAIRFMRYRDTPIRLKLMVILLVTSGVVVSLSCAAFFAYELATYQKRSIEGLASLGGIVAHNSVVALMSPSESDANNVLAALKARPHIVAASLYKDNRLFARYPAGASADAFPAVPRNDGFHVERSHQIGFLPVVRGDGVRIGTLYLDSDMKLVHARYRTYAALAALIVLLSLAVAYPLAAQMQRHISRPILAMTEIAAAISVRGDYSVRAEKGGDDELGQLTDAFNQMLDQIDQKSRALRESHERLNLALQASGVGTWGWDIGENRMSWDAYTHPLFGLPEGSFAGSYDSFRALVHEDDRARVHDEMQLAITSGGAYQSSLRTVWPDGSVHDLCARGKVLATEVGGHRNMTGVFWDITEQKLADARLQSLVTDLERSNKELEMFAYVASHDLQEPLRMVSSYTQLLERRYSAKLDDDAREFINFAVDGATRMQRLINDLLTFSRVSIHGKPMTLTNVAEILGGIRVDLGVTMEEGGTVLTNDDMPEVMADPTQLSQLLQNLIGNAIKFHNGKRSHVHVHVTDTPANWEFSVRDNGIGIEPEYFDRIFVIFQRLHGKGVYPGTGIGLALCKRIVERHGGSIWVESELGTGSTFFFTIPKVATT